ncbi:MAG: hypothetical protein R3F49_04905 [Planctomycetota bacterium]
MSQQSEHLVSATAAPDRTVPADLLRSTSPYGYIVGTCESAEEAERGVRSLVSAGIPLSEVLLVGNEVATVRPFSGDGAIEVLNSARHARAGGRVAGVVTGAAAGALSGALAASLVGWTIPIAVAIGALLGTALGVVGGAWMANLFRRSPDRHYDAVCSDSDVLVGVGLDSGQSQGRRQRIERALSQVGILHQWIASDDPGSKRLLAGVTASASSVP